jgi:hypothetical protein
MRADTQKSLPFLNLWFLLAAMLVLHAGLWMSVREVKARWANVPPVPSISGTAAMMLGDRQMAYRVAGLMLQNLGNTGGRSEAFKNYDYQRLKEWLLLAWALDSKSNFVPYLASYYFGSVEDPEKIRPLVEYLIIAGRGMTGEKWRWMAQAIYLTRYKLKSPDRAYELATELAARQDETMPIWARQMPAFIMTAKGDKQAAYDIMVNILKSSAEKMPAEEVNFMRHYICDKLLDKAQAATNPLCKDLGR